jgi:hypothetical protein
MSALSGDVSAALSVNFFNSKVADWEYVVEPFPVALTMDQMPNELVSFLDPYETVWHHTRIFSLPLSTSGSEFFV